MTPPPLILLSDVDGTLISDDGRLPVAPPRLRDTIRRVAHRCGGTFRVGLASSRTLRELTVLQRALGLPGPCIAEDGAKRATDIEGPRGPDTDPLERHGRRLLHVFEHALPADALREMMQDQDAFVRADTRRLSSDALDALGFRSTGTRRRALLDRTHSVLLDPRRWFADELADLRTVCEARGLQLRRGGRWYTLTTAGGKGPALCALRHQFTVDGVSPIVAAIGNEENDESLLAEADLRFVIRNPHRGPHPVLSSLPRAIVLDAEGTGGWMEMLERLVPSAQAWLETRP